jgi:hypothetical protein
VLLPGERINRPPRSFKQSKVAAVTANTLRRLALGVGPVGLEEDCLRCDGALLEASRPAGAATKRAPQGAEPSQGRSPSQEHGPA